MRSRAERLREVAEIVLRGVALAGLALLLWRALRPPTMSSADVASGDLGAALARWTARAPTDVHVAIDSVPDPRTRDWMRALRAAGTTVRWSASKPLAPAAIVAEPAADPYGATRVRLASNAGEPAALVDAAGLVDSLPRGGNAELELGVITGDLRVRGASFAAATSPRDRLTLRPVLVLGAAGWEPKFTIAALEESGWRVAARLRVAPAIEVTQGPLGAIDTAQYSAVVVVDSTAASSAAAIARYARSGGGVVLVGTAARISALAAVAPGSIGRRVAGVAGAVASDAPRTGLGAFAIASPRADAVALEARDDMVLVAARRAHAGRVVQTGYDETWRWRMSGGDDAVRAHRDWWSRLVGAVAYAPLQPVVSEADFARDEAPLAGLHAALGAPVPMASPVESDRDPSRTTRILFVIVVGALLLEWLSRRLRGAR
jgi:hypothetical protein